MKFSVLVHAAPCTSPGSLSALNFCRAVVANGHKIHRVFFFRDGAHNASLLPVALHNEATLQSQWQELLQQHAIEAIVCVTSGLRRGVIQDQDARRFDKPCSNLSPGFEVSGLGQLVDSCLQADRIISFG